MRKILRPLGADAGVAVAPECAQARTALAIAMVVLRGTQKILKSLPVTAADDDRSDTALGDWYVNRISIDRQSLLLLLSSRSLLAIVTRARDIRSLPARLSALVGTRLARLGLDADLIASETSAMAVTRVSRTNDRSVTVQMVYFAKAFPYRIPADGWNDSAFQFVEDRFSGTPCRCDRPLSEVIFPAQMTKTLLTERWRNKGVVH